MTNNIKLCDLNMRFLFIYILKFKNRKNVIIVFNNILE